MFNLTNVELNMCVSIIFGFISKIMALIVTSAFKVLYRISRKVLTLVPFISCMAGKVFVMTHVLLEYHIKVKKSGGAFKVIPAILMHYYSGMFDSDLKRIEGQKESCMRTKIASMTCKKYSKMKNLMSS